MDSFLDLLDGPKSPPKKKSTDLADSSYKAPVEIMSQNDIPKALELSIQILEFEPDNKMIKEYNIALKAIVDQGIESDDDDDDDDESKDDDSNSKSSDDDDDDDDNDNDSSDEKYSNSDYNKVNQEKTSKGLPSEDKSKNVVYIEKAEEKESKIKGITGKSSRDSKK